MRPKLSMPETASERLVRLLTAENRMLLEMIRARKPGLIAELSALSGRSAANLTRTLAKFEAAVLVRFEEHARRKTPVATARTRRVEIDPYRLSDKIEF